MQAEERGQNGVCRGAPRRARAAGPTCRTPEGPQRPAPPPGPASRKQQREQEGGSCSLLAVAVAVGVNGPLTPPPPTPGVPGSRGRDHAQVLTGPDGKQRPPLGQGRPDLDVQGPARPRSSPPPRGARPSHAQQENGLQRSSSHARCCSQGRRQQAAPGSVGSGDKPGPEAEARGTAKLRPQFPVKKDPVAAAWPRSRP